MPTHSFFIAKITAALACSLALVACGPPDEASRTKAGPIVGPFVVSDFFTPSGLMGDGAVPGRVSEGIDENCKQPRPAGAQGDCYHFLYHIGDVKWAGAFWVYPSNSWGSVPGRALAPPLDLGPDGMGGELHGYKRVRFWAAVDVMPTPPILHYFVGGIDGTVASPPRPYADKGCQIFPADPTDPTSMRQVFCGTGFREGDAGNSYLTGQWQQFSIPLDRWGLTSVIGAFGFSINDTENPGQTLSIYIDDIVWDAQ